MIRKMIKLVLWVSVWLWAVAAVAQADEIQRLEKERVEALKEIEETSSKLNRNKKDVTNTLERIRLMNKEIGIRRSIISDLDKEVNRLGRDERNLSREVSYLQQKLKLRKKDYALALQRMWRKRGDVDQMLFVFSAQNIAQAMRRARYMKEYAVYQRIKGEEIRQKEIELNGKIVLLNKKKQEKQKVLEKVEGERATLEEREVAQQKVMKELKSQEKQLQRQLADQRTRATRLANRIKVIIEEEARKAAEQARREAEAQAKAQSAKGSKKKGAASSSKSKGFVMDSAAKELSGEFSANKGNLPAPINAAYQVTAYYGEQSHPDLPKVMVNNHGIELQAIGAADARAVYEGVVSRVFAVPGSNTSVMVRHGNYFTIYSNLSSIYVKQGDKVKTRQALGRIYVERGRSVLQFQLWKETNRMNPLPWISK